MRLNGDVKEKLVAQRRMFNQTVVNSDAFLDMPPSAQNLYFHLNMGADDEGFIDNGKTIKRLASASDEDLKTLLKKRYILEFKSGVMVVKHWKIHNTIRHDRIKPTLYIEEKKLLEEKTNGIYTERCKPIQDKEINDDSIEAAESQHRCTPSIVEYSIVKDSIVEINNKENNKENISYLVRETISHWNSKNLPICKHTMATLPEISEVASKVSVYTLEEINKAIDNFAEKYDDLECKVKSYHRFIIVSLENWLDSALVSKKTDEQRPINYSEGYND